MRAQRQPRKPKPASLPDFIRTTSDARYSVNLRLAEYGNKIAVRQDAILFVERLTLWREQLPESLEALRRGKGRLLTWLMAGA